MEVIGVGVPADLLAYGGARKSVVARREATVLAQRGRYHRQARVTSLGALHDRNPHTALEVGVYHQIGCKQRNKFTLFCQLLLWMTGC